MRSHNVKSLLRKKRSLQGLQKDFMQTQRQAQDRTRATDEDISGQRKTKEDLWRQT